MSTEELFNKFVRGQLTEAEMIKMNELSGEDLMQFRELLETRYTIVVQYQESEYTIDMGYSETISDLNAKLAVLRKASGNYSFSRSADSRIIFLSRR
jgi:hypothetical protein